MPLADPLADPPVDPLVDPLVEQLLAAQAQHACFAGPTLVVVAVSGGRDSVCLLHALRTLAPTWDLDLHVAHVDHGLRVESAADRAWVSDLCAAWGLPCHTTVLDPIVLRADPLGVEGAARQARYACLARTARALAAAAPVAGRGASVCITTAHHAGDQAETVLLRLVQGSGLRGLGAMRPVATVPGEAGELPVRLVRPLLAVAPADIDAYMARWGLAWREDASNAGLHPLRNRLRHTVLPALAALNPALLETLARTADVLAAEAERAAAADRLALADLTLAAQAGRDGNRCVLDLVRWQVLPLAARRGVVRAVLADLGADEREVGFAAVERIVAGAQPRTGGPHPIAGAGMAALAWSTVGATPTRPALLSLHRNAALPVAPDHPWLDGAWQTAHDPLPVPLGTWVAAGAWQLRATLLAAADVPGGWAEEGGTWRLLLAPEWAGSLLLTVPAPGLRIAPQGMGGRHKLVADVLAAAKVHPRLRPGWPLLVDRDSGRVLWVCGLRRAEGIGPEDRPDGSPGATAAQVLCVEWEPAAE